MLFDVIGRLFRSAKSVTALEQRIQDRKLEADDLRSQGRLHEAIEAYRECLDVDRFNVDLLNSLGACLDDIGDDEGGREYFELAYSIDDTYIPGVVNYAKKLADKRDSTRAVELLEYINTCEPGYNHVFPIFASVCFARGEAERAAAFQLKGWLGSFDSLRSANSYLFTLAYSGPEYRLASEHRFWAETLRKVDLAEELATLHEKVGDVVTPVLPLPATFPVGRKLRIGYWSPDLRGHSVAYFFRPLLLNHDRSRFEIFVYHDSFKRDSVTDAVNASCDHFHDVYFLNDAQLYELMRSHQLDVLVEMAGHTSANRLMLFKNNRFANLHITGIGYPPTTGLAEVDVKLLDRHLVTEDASNFYAERPLVLPSSFWCFEAMGADGVDIDSDLPVERNGYVTFACVGNISKIGKPILECWRRILASVPNSRLLIRSISFEDPTAQAALSKQMAEAGLDESRIDLRPAVGGAGFYQSYNDIDIILDTYPFNGGTTSCFATYMGVPVITRAGESLISRMGLSVMANLGAQDWVAYDETSYVENAIRAANDISFLKDFRLKGRERFLASALGNGKLFAAEFEGACERALAERLSKGWEWCSTIPALPADEIMRRAYAVWQSGNGDAAARILQHCLNHYPDCGGAHLFIALQLSVKGQFREAIAYLVERHVRFDKPDQVASMINIIRWSLLLGDQEGAKLWLARALNLNVEDPFDLMQLRLFDARLSGAALTSAVNVCAEVSGHQRVVVVIPCDDNDYFLAMQMRMNALCLVPNGCAVRYVRCSESTRARDFKQWMQSSDTDVLIIMQRVIEIVNPNFFHEVLAALSTTVDVVGVAGASQWMRANWRGDKFEAKSAGFLIESRETDGFLEVQCLGGADGVLVPGQAVLDGSLLAIRTDRVEGEFDEALALLNWALEEDWTHSAAEKGARLAVHRNLGVLIHDAPSVERSRQYPGLIRLQEKYKFPLFSEDRDDLMVLSVPVQNAEDAASVMQRYCSSLIV